MPENGLSGSSPRRLAERPHRLDERTRPRITVQVIDGKICCEFTPAATPAGGPELKP